MREKVLSQHSLGFEDLDDVDKLIMELMQRDDQLTIRQLGELTGLSQTAIRARKDKIEKVFVRGHVALINCQLLGYREMVMASIRVYASQPLAKIKADIEEMDEVREAYIMTGPYPIFVMAKCLDHEQTIALIEKLRCLPGVEEVTTQLVLDRIKEDTHVDIPGLDKEYVDKIIQSHSITLDDPTNEQES
jgi:DNA-binding Lrp family transcriptional regulator